MNGDGESGSKRLLTDADAARYRSDGFIVPEFRLPEARVEDLRNALDRLIADNPTVRPERLVSAHVEGGAGEGVRGAAAFLDLARDPDIVDYVEQLIGPDIILWGCQVFCKPPLDGMEVPWHQDGQYWPIRPLATCTVWVALDSSDRENGCLKVIPGSHRSGAVYVHEPDAREDIVLSQRLLEGQFDIGAAQHVELQPGAMSIHDVYLIHGSDPNRSDRRRAGVALRYMPATSRFDHQLIAAGSAAGYLVDYVRRPIWLLRGVDRTGSNDFTVGHPTG